MEYMASGASPDGRSCIAGDLFFGRGQNPNGPVKARDHAHMRQPASFTRSFPHPGRELLNIRIHECGQAVTLVVGAQKKQIRATIARATHRADGFALVLDVKPPARPFRDLRDF